MSTTSLHLPARIGVALLALLASWGPEPLAARQGGGAFLAGEVVDAGTLAPLTHAVVRI